MKELLRIVESPRRCSYLPSEVASLEFRIVHDMSPAEYGDLLSRGYRRFGWQIFRPQCSACSQCRSMRIVTSQFDPSASERRVLRQNAHIRAELHHLFATREHVDLYNRYQRFMHEHRGWALQQATLSEYRDTFTSGAAHLGKQWLYFDSSKLVGIGTMDEAPAQFRSSTLFTIPLGARFLLADSTYSISFSMLASRASATPIWDTGSQTALP